jgi:hypothetical protein
MTHPAALPPEKLLVECETRRLRRSGPGGQHRNKVETAVALLHKPTGVKAEASERRSQAENHAMAVFRLRLNLALEIRRTLDADYVPSELWRSRVVVGKISISERHDDFPSLLAESLDVIAAQHADISTAAKSLGCTASQLVKFLQREPRAFQLVNRWREEADLHRLR